MYVLFKLCTALFSLHSYFLTTEIRQKRRFFFLIRPNYHSTSPELFPVLVFLHLHFCILYSRCITNCIFAEAERRYRSYSLVLSKEICESKAAKGLAPHTNGHLHITQNYPPFMVPKLHNNTIILPCIFHNHRVIATLPAIYENFLTVKYYLKCNFPLICSAIDSRIVLMVCFNSK